MSNYGKFLNSHTVQMERVYPYPIETVFDYFSKAELLSTWLMPATVELKAGGRIQFKCDPVPDSVGVEPIEAQECFIRGLISDYEPLRLIAYSWNETNYSTASYIKFEFEETPDGVRVVLTHSHLPAEFMAAVGAGWQIHLGTVLTLLKGEKPVDFYTLFNPLLEEYKVLVVAAGIVVASTAPSAALASPQSDAFQTVKHERQVLLKKFDQLWRDADDVKFKIDQLSKVPDRDDRSMNSLERDLQSIYKDLHDTERCIKDLELALK